LAIVLWLWRPQGPEADFELQVRQLRVYGADLQLFQMGFHEAITNVINPRLVLIYVLLQIYDVSWFESAINSTETLKYMRTLKLLSKTD